MHLGVQFCHLSCYLFHHGTCVKSFAPLVLSAPGVSVFYEGNQAVFRQWESHYASPFIRSLTSSKTSAVRSIPTRSTSDRGARNPASLAVETDEEPIVPYAAPPIQLFSHQYSVLGYQQQRYTVVTRYGATQFTSFRNSSLVEAENQYMSFHHLNNSYKRIFPVLFGKEVQVTERNSRRVK